MDNCIFCKIIKGEIPCYKIYEDEHTLAFLDISEDYFGHTLVVPKQHCANILDASADALRRVLSSVKKISRHYVKHCHASGINVLNNNGESAGQSVMHLHFHIIPKGNFKKCKLDEQQNLLCLK